jgi:hypothetical protein
MEEGRRQPIVSSLEGQGPRDYTFWSLVTTFMFNIGLGLAALYLTIKSRERWREGHTIEAARFARLSKNLNVLSLVIGVITLFFIFVYASMVSAALQSIINRQ